MTSRECGSVLSVQNTQFLARNKSVWTRTKPDRKHCNELVAKRREQGRRAGGASALCTIRKGIDSPLPLGPLSVEERE